MFQLPVFYVLKIRSDFPVLKKQMFQLFVDCHHPTKREEIEKNKYRLILPK